MSLMHWIFVTVTRNKVSYWGWTSTLSKLLFLFKWAILRDDAIGALCTYAGNNTVSRSYTL
jgi:hypothetical protein